jgi:hypothetical protein
MYNHLVQKNNLLQQYQEESQSYHVSLERGAPKKPLLLKEAEAIGHYYTSELRKAYLNFQCDCREELTLIDKMVFSKNSIFLLIISKSLYAWILNTVKWNTEDIIDFKTLSYNLEPGEEHLKVNLGSLNSDVLGD